MSDSLEKFEDFGDFYRLQGQSITEYIAVFDSTTCKYKKIEKKHVALPAAVLAYKLLRKAYITKEEKLLVLTDMNYDNKKTLYKEAKKSLKKFKGDSECSSNSSNAAVKLEPTFLAENEEALFAAGYLKRKRGKQGG